MESIHKDNGSELVEIRKLYVKDEILESTLVGRVLISFDKDEVTVRGKTICSRNALAVVSKPFNGVKQNADEFIRKAIKVIHRDRLFLKENWHYLA